MSDSLTCNFTIKTSLDVGVSFQSDEANAANWGGEITIFTPCSVQPVTTSLWDSDGDVFFTIYNVANPSLSCMIDSGANPMTWAPYVNVCQQAGLTCAISAPQPAGEGVFNYTLTVGLAGAAVSKPQETAATAAPPAPQHVARMILPAGGKEAWTEIMQGVVPVAGEINTGSPIVMAWARFDDGTRVAGGVYKSDTPTDYNVKFMWVFDRNGNQYPGWPIDVSDDEDFLTKAYAFALGADGEEKTYLLKIVEKQG